MQKGSFDLLFIKKEKIAKDTYSFVFARPRNEFDFVPGQYISFSLDGKQGKITHDFSIASSPLDVATVRITTKMGTSEFKKLLFGLVAGDIAHCLPPAGGFVFDERDKHPAVFLAGGIGVVPFVSMLVYLAEKKRKIPVILIASFASREDVLFHDELCRIAQQHTEFHYLVTMTDYPSFTNEKGRISKELVEKYVSDIKKSTYYLAGSPGFVDAMEALLEDMHVPLENIRMEQFTGY